MIKGLDQRVDIVFEPDAKHFLLAIPYCAASKEFLGCYSMTGLGIQREWKPELRAYRFSSNNFYDIVELLPDFFPVPEDIFGKGDESNDYSLSDCRPAGSLDNIRPRRKRQAKKHVS
jgi:hypothetical protein